MLSLHFQVDTLNSRLPSFKNQQDRFYSYVFLIIFGLLLFSKHSPTLSFSLELWNISFSYSIIKMDLDPLMKGNLEKRIDIQSPYNQPYTQKEFNSAYDYVKVEKPGMYYLLKVINNKLTFIATKHQHLHV